MTLIGGLQKGSRSLAEGAMLGMGGARLRRNEIQRSDTVSVQGEPWRTMENHGEPTCDPGDIFHSGLLLLGNTFLDNLRHTNVQKN